MTEKQLLLKFVDKFGDPKLSAKKVNPYIVDMTNIMIDELASTGTSKDLDTDFEYLVYRKNTSQQFKAYWGDVADQIPGKGKENMIKVNKNIIKFLKYYINESQLNIEIVNRDEPEFTREYIIEKLESKKLKGGAKPQEKTPKQEKKKDNFKEAENDYKKFFKSSMVQNLLKYGYESYGDNKITLTPENKKNLEQKESSLYIQYRPRPDEFQNYNEKKSKELIINNLISRISTSLNITIEIYNNEIKEFNKKYTQENIVELAEKKGSIETKKIIEKEIKKNDFIFKNLESLIDKTFKTISSEFNPKKGSISKEKIIESYERIKKQIKIDKNKTTYEKTKRLIPRRLDEASLDFDVIQTDEKLESKK